MGIEHLALFLSLLANLFFVIHSSCLREELAEIGIELKDAEAKIKHLEECHLMAAIQLKAEKFNQSIKVEEP